MCGGEELGCYEDLVLLAEFFNNGKALGVIRGKLHSYSEGDLDEGMVLEMADPINYDFQPFSPASNGVDSVPGILSTDRSLVILYVMDMSTGVMASLLDMWLEHHYHDEEPELVGQSARLNCRVGPVPVTSMTYAGPPLQAQVSNSSAWLLSGYEVVAGVSRPWPWFGAGRAVFARRRPTQTL